jgi:hypothetical protein
MEGLASKTGVNRGVQMSAGYPFRRWSVASSRTVLANRVLKVRLDTCVIPASGGALEYFVLELADWVNVVPVTSARELVMVSNIGMRPAALHWRYRLARRRRTKCPPTRLAVSCWRRRDKLVGP